MKITDFLKDKAIIIILIMAALTINSLLLILLKVGTFAIFFINFILVLALFIALTIEYIKKWRYYSQVLKTMDKIDKKFLLSELVSKSNFIEAKILYRILKETNKSMNDEIYIYKEQSKDYREYIEMWIHEVKTPISAGKLVAKNHPSIEMKNIEEELDSIERYVEQVLFYAKSFTLNDDYVIKKTKLETLINRTIRKNSNILILNKVKIEKHNLNKIVYADEKWMEFVISQIIINSVNYLDKVDKLISFSAEEKANSIILSIRDNGMGINIKDINRVFEKGYIGENGRKIGKSTGIGLYICKRLCDNLNIGINIISVHKKSTTVNIIFPKTKLAFLES